MCDKASGKSVVSPKVALPATGVALASAALESHNTVSATTVPPVGAASAPQLASVAIASASASEQQQELPTTSGMSGGGVGAAGASVASGEGSGGIQLMQPNVKDIRELCDIKQLLWGDGVREDVFKRWSQGFEFSDVEPSALVQKQGGPCAVIAPVQAYLLKIIIMDMPGIKLAEISSGKSQSLLIQALCNILLNCQTRRYRIVHILRRSSNATSSTGTTTVTTQSNRNAKPNLSSAARTTKENTPPVPPPPLTQVLGEEVAGGAAVGGVCVIPSAGAGDAAYDIEIEQGVEVTPASVIDIIQGNSSGSSNSNSNSLNDDDATGQLDMDITSQQFHERLHTIHFDDINEVARYYTENYSQLSNTFGVLVFMYSVFLTKGIEQVTADISDTSEPLIHSTYGYGAQSLINLMLTGRSVAHVWDNEQDVGGLKLRGISEQSDIGFITLMEQMRYCTVGSFFKNPRFPVWVMGSDTHLTVLFSNEKRLVSPETPSETGRRIFKSYDPEGNNFISSTMLRDVLAALNLVSEPGYVSLMQKRLDPENLGIILLNAFMDEFFPLESRSTPDTFELMHYNGIPGSNEGNKVRYYYGSAILLEGDLKSICTSNPIVTCLQTKWPNIEINWHNMHMPSLN
ncbi:ubiquitin carboxyl-terminal hydrolase MINDY-3 homolog [Drosophila tropicalis]|uniref:ubiquitin carboxyl-terminal hydrolase MINDY-3 homolog n=1 Tax=Drosophila tropicalis TaxID=46794 RepID=UPI0035AC1EC7